MRFAVVAVCAIAAVKAIMLPEPVNVFAQITPVAAPAVSSSTTVTEKEIAKSDKKMADPNRTGSKASNKLSRKLAEMGDNAAS